MVREVAWANISVMLFRGMLPSSSASSAGMESRAGYGSRAIAPCSAVLTGTAELRGEPADVSDRRRVDVRYRLPEEDISGMHGAVHRAPDRTDAGRHQLALVGEPLVSQRVKFVDGDNVRGEPGQVGVARARRPAGRLVSMRTCRVVQGAHNRQQSAADEVIVILPLRRKFRLLTPRSRDHRAHRVHAVDLVQPAFLLCLERSGEREVATARLSGDHHRVRHPADCRGAVRKARGVWVHSQWSGRVMYLDTGDNETRQRQFVAPADVTAVRRAEDDPAAAVEMEESGQHTPGTFWAVEEYHYLVSVRPRDRDGPALHAGHGRQVGEQRGEDRSEAILGALAEGQQFLPRRRRRNGRSGLV